MTRFPQRPALIFLGLFILLSLVTLLRHEMWRDELQAWLLAREQTSFGDLFQAARYEKHPMAWFIVLFLLSRWTSSPLAMQLLHVGLATLSAWLVLRFAPFSGLQKVLLIFSYYLFYEYNIISRNYALGVLALFLFCHSYVSPKKRPLAWAVCLFVLANSNVYGLILATAAGAVVAIDVLGDEALRKGWTSFLALIIIGLGGILSLLSLRPVPDSSYDQVSRVHTAFHPDLANKVLRILPESYLEMPRPTFHFWNTHLLEKIPTPFVASAVLAVLCVLLATVVVSKKRSAAIFFFLGTVGILSWLYIGSIGFVRHRGHLFMTLIAALWMALGSYHRLKSSPPQAIGRGSGGKISFSILTLILVVQAAGGIFAAGMDIVYPFSQARAIARFIRQKGYADLPIVGEMDYLMTPVSGYLNRKIYFVRGERMGSYVKWDMRRFQDVSPRMILERAGQFARNKRKDCLILLNFHLDPTLERPDYLVKLAATDRAIVRGEVYRLYLLKFTGP